jgi:hypothetical protein
MTEQNTALGTESRTAVIDNGAFGTREVTFFTGRLAKQAAGSVIVQLGDTTVLSATTASKQPKEHFDFFPLTVDVEERMYAAGRIPGSFFRREGRPSEDAILTCRLIDRPLRPSFTKGLRNEVQVVETIWTSLRRPFLNDGRSGRSVSRQVRIASSDGRPSRRKNEPGMRPAAYMRSSTSTVSGKKSKCSLGALLAVVAERTTVSPSWTTTEPAACLARRPVENVTSRVPKAPLSMMAVRD